MTEERIAEIMLAVQTACEGKSVASGMHAAFEALLRELSKEQDAPQPIEIIINDGSDNG